MIINTRDTGIQGHINQRNTKVIFSSKSDILMISQNSHSSFQFPTVSILEPLLDKSTRIWEKLCATKTNGSETNCEDFFKSTRIWGKNWRSFITEDLPCSQKGFQQLFCISQSSSWTNNKYHCFWNCAFQCLEFYLFYSDLWLHWVARNEVTSP